MNTFTPVDGSHLSKEGKNYEITSLMSLNEKLVGRIRGRSCADGFGQRGKSEKEDTASPTVATEIIFITSAIDAHERRDVATIDTTGAFLHADSYEHIFMVLKGKLDILICNVDKKLNRKYIIFDKRGKNVLYVKMLKALYGMLRSALLFYRKLVKDLLNTDLKRTHTVIVFLTVLTMENN